LVPGALREKEAGRWSQRGRENEKHDKYAIIEEKGEEREMGIQLSKKGMGRDRRPERGG